MSPGSRGASRPRKTWPWPSGNGLSLSFPTGCCGRSGSGRPTRTGLRSVTRPEAPAGAARELRRRYTAADLSVFTGDEASRFVPQGEGDPQTDIVLAWELLYRLEPELYDRLADAERLHPDVLGWLPGRGDRGARGGGVVAVEPAKPLRQILRRKLAAVDHGDRARVIHGFFDELPLPDDF